MPDQAAELDVEDDAAEDDDEDVEEEDEEDEDEESEDEEDEESDEPELSLFAAGLLDPPLVLLEEERLSFR
ncbi:TATA-binding protein-associated factor Taf7 [Streptomyces demainii]|uniref:TATA-binding protein-associated factor Taf7 n=1 Tax=Streptomyces demainii TaxID=588122 RepID=A0ABT9KX18_9ACTN|nr:TATA-binding protein-associated factor Taf7 [Streptomyces demainii]